MNENSTYKYVNKNTWMDGQKGVWESECSVIIGEE